MRDRLLTGGLAGLLTGTWVLASEVFWHNLTHVAQSSWLDGMVYLVLGHTGKSAGDYAAGAAGQLVFTSILGGLFPRLVIPQPGEGHYALRGLGYGALSWWVLLAITAIYHVPEIGVITWRTAFTTLFSALTWGLLFGWLFRRWDREESAA